MPPKPDPGDRGFFALLTNVFNPSKHEIAEHDAQRFEDGLPDGAVKSEVEAYVCLRMTVCEKINRTGTTLTEYFCEDFVNATEDVFRCKNGDLCKTFRDYLRERRVFVPKKENTNISDVLAVAVEEKWSNPL